MAYSPKGPSHIEPHRSSQSFRNAIKNDGLYRQQRAIELAVQRLIEDHPAVLRPFFGEGTVLVPAPSSTPFPQNLKIPLQGGEKDFLWVPRRICQALAAARSTISWRPLLRRDRRVNQSSRAHAKDRPSPQDHFDSLSCQRDLIPAGRYVVVDDVVTRGATLLACASKLKDVYPQSEILGFALLRAISNPEDFASILAPVAGTISLRSQGDTLRRP